MLSDIELQRVIFSADTIKKYNDFIKGFYLIDDRTKSYRRWFICNGYKFYYVRTGWKHPQVQNR